MTELQLVQALNRVYAGIQYGGEPWVPFCRYMLATRSMTDLEVCSTWYAFRAGWDARGPVQK